MIFFDMCRVYYLVKSRVVNRFLICMDSLLKYRKIYKYECYLGFNFLMI